MKSKIAVVVTMVVISSVSYAQNPIKRAWNQMTDADVKEEKQAYNEAKQAERQARQEYNNARANMQDRCSIAANTENIPVVGKLNRTGCDIAKGQEGRALSDYSVDRDDMIAKKRELDAAKKRTGNW